MKGGYMNGDLVELFISHLIILLFVFYDKITVSGYLFTATTYTRCMLHVDV